MRACRRPLDFAPFWRVLLELFPDEQEKRTSSSSRRKALSQGKGAFFSFVHFFVSDYALGDRQAVTAFGVAVPTGHC